MHSDSLTLLSRKHSADYLSEDDLLYLDPAAFITTRFVEPAAIDIDPDTQLYRWPNQLVLFDALMRHSSAHSGQNIGDLLAKQGYAEEKRFWNSILHEDPRRSGDIVVLRRQHRSGSSGDASAET